MLRHPGEPRSPPNFLEAKIRWPRMILGWVDVGREPSAGRLQVVGSRKATEPEARTATGRGARVTREVRRTGRISLRFSALREPKLQPEAEPRARKDLPKHQTRRSGARPARRSADRKSVLGLDTTLEETVEPKGLVLLASPSTAGSGCRGHSRGAMRNLLNLLGYSWNKLWETMRPSSV